ncbi:MAG: phytanoyl-CoA dioxygenase family protein [Burkholderiales bacterium]
MTMATASKPALSTHEPKVHNHLLGDFAALDRALDTEGYWFFRDVLDKDAIARLRRIYTEELEAFDVIDPVGDAPTEASVPYNGRGDVTRLPRHMDPIADRKAWQTFVAEKPIHDFLVRLLGGEPFWKPVVEYRATPPGQQAANRLTGIHQDGPATPGVDFITMWVPVAEIDWQVGGITFAEGFAQPVNRRVYDETGTARGVPINALPEDCWCHTTWRPGDVLFMNCWLPHSGLTNISDRFRLSFDHRVMRRGSIHPVIGDVVSIAPDRIEVRDEQGVKALRIEHETYARTTHHDRLWGDAILKEFAPGTRVIVGHDNGVATVIRPTHNE